MQKLLPATLEALWSNIAFAAKRIGSSRNEPPQSTIPQSRLEPLIQHHIPRLQPVMQDPGAALKVQIPQPFNDTNSNPMPRLPSEAQLPRPHPLHRILQAPTWDVIVHQEQPLLFPNISPQAHHVTVLHSRKQFKLPLQSSLCRARCHRTRAPTGRHSGGIELDAFNCENERIVKG